MNDASNSSVFRKPLHKVAVLHSQGYQRLRIYPAMSPSGMSWRVSVAPSSLCSNSHGAELERDDLGSDLIARYTSAAEDRYFGWRRSPGATPQTLAVRFRKRFPEIIDESQGTDSAYVAWYLEMLSLTEPDHFPYAFADWPTPDDYLPTVSLTSDLVIRVPLPPLSPVQPRS
jgi:hypothetical protein